jgi:hypothetical protein
MQSLNGHCRLDGAIGPAAFTYFVLVFAAGFVLGAIRIFLAAPLWGELPAVILESPIMIFVSWLACGSTMRSFGIRERRAGLAVGAIAFVLLMIAELALSVVAFGRPPADFLHAFRTPAGAVGLAGQIAFALIPFFRARPFRNSAI